MFGATITVTAVIAIVLVLVPIDVQVGTMSIVRQLAGVETDEASEAGDSSHRKDETTAFPFTEDHDQSDSFFVNMPGVSNVRLLEPRAVRIADVPLGSLQVGS